MAVYKPKGMTSQDVCSEIKHILQPFTGEEKLIKVGHGGTLDPMAEGVMVIGIREGCKSMDQYLKGSKSYRATALLGCETDTLDAEGQLLEPVSCGHITINMLKKALIQFRGDTLQTPPMFSALKHKGKRMYEIAREGKTVERKPRPVSVLELELIDSASRLPEFSFDVTCGGGFYVRSLIADLAKACGGAAHMTALVRTRQGPYTLDDTLKREDWKYENIYNTIYEHSEKAGFKTVVPTGI